MRMRIHRAAIAIAAASALLVASCVPQSTGNPTLDAILQKAAVVAASVCNVEVQAVSLINLVPPAVMAQINTLVPGQILSIGVAIGNAVCASVLAQKRAMTRRYGAARFSATPQTVVVNYNGVSAYVTVVQH